MLEAVLTSQLEVSGSTRCEMFGQGCLLCEAKVCQGCSGNLEKIKYCYGAGAPKKLQKDSKNDILFLSRYGGRVDT